VRSANCAMVDRSDRPPFQPRMCTTCGLVLTPWEHDGKVTWSHGQPVDHETVVGPLVNPELRCDFCSSTDPKWNAECTPFLMRTNVGGFDVSAQDDGAWAACDTCASYLRRKDWPRLLYRATKAFEWPYGVDGGQAIARMHDEFRQHYTGVVTAL
jgi:hypothetical protein